MPTFPTLTRGPIGDSIIGLRFQGGQSVRTLVQHRADFLSPTRTTAKTSKKAPLPMIEFTVEEIDVLLTWLDFSKDRMRSAPDMPSDVRQTNIQSIEQVSQKLRSARRELASGQ